MDSRRKSMEPQQNKDEILDIDDYQRNKSRVKMTRNFSIKSDIKSKEIADLRRVSMSMPILPDAKDDGTRETILIKAPTLA